MTPTRSGSAPRTAPAIPSRIAWSSALRLPGFETVSRRTPSSGSSTRTSPGMARDPSGRQRPDGLCVLENHQGVALVDGLALLAQDLADHAGVLGLDGHLHLHRLEDDDGVALLDGVAHLALDLPHRARDVGLDVRHSGPPRFGSWRTIRPRPAGEPRTPHLRPGVGGRPRGRLPSFRSCTAPGSHEGLTVSSCDTKPGTGRRTRTHPTGPDPAGGVYGRTGSGPRGACAEDGTASAAGRATDPVRPPFRPRAHRSAGAGASRAGARPRRGRR